VPSAEETWAAWRGAAAVCFDVDSTVITGEGLDDLAHWCGKGEAVKQITRDAMRGGLDFRSALRQRLELLRPSLRDVTTFVAKHPSQLTPGIQEVVRRLRQRGVAVYLVSGGFLSLIAPVARQLDIPLENVYANRLHFLYDGSYAGFDEEQPTSRSHGKAEVVRRLQAEGAGTVVVVGDGATDMEACPPAQGFIGFGGNVVREAVQRDAPVFVTSFDECLRQLPR